MFKPFIPAENLKLVPNYSALDTLTLEERMKTRNGNVDLATLPSYHPPGKCNYLYSEVPYFVKSKFDPPDLNQIREIISKYPAIKSPCSMLVGSMEELIKHMARGYQVAHFHYILGKKYNLDGEFPKYCCGISSGNVLFSLLSKGYPNAAICRNKKHDHTYVFLPFVMDDLKGSIIIDPTSDQLWESDSLDGDYDHQARGRNAVFIKQGKKWTYRTHWAKGADLFPDEVLSVDILTKTVSQNHLEKYDYHLGGKKYLSGAFENPVKL